MGAIAQPRVRFNFDYERKKWILETPLALDARGVTILMNNAKLQYSFRIKGEIGEKKRRMEEAVSMLSLLNIEQWLVGNGEKTLYLGKGQKL